MPSPKCGPDLSKHITHATDQLENRHIHHFSNGGFLLNSLGPPLNCFCHAEKIHKPLDIASLLWNVCPLFQRNCLLNGDLLNIRTLLSWKWEERMRRGTLAVFSVMQALTHLGVSLSNPAPTFYMMIDNLELWTEAVMTRQQELNPNWPSDTHGETI